MTDAGGGYLFGFMGRCGTGVGVGINGVLRDLLASFISLSIFPGVAGGNFFAVVVYMHDVCK